MDNTDEDFSETAQSDDPKEQQSLEQFHQLRHSLIKEVESIA